MRFSERRARLGRSDEDAAADLDDDQPHGLEHRQSLAQRRPADAELPGEVALRGQAVAGLQPAAQDQPLKVARDIARNRPALRTIELRQGQSVFAHGPAPNRLSDVSCTELPRIA